MFFFFKQKTAYELRISDWSSDVCSSDLRLSVPTRRGPSALRPPPASLLARSRRMRPPRSSSDGSSPRAASGGTRSQASDRSSPGTGATAERPSDRTSVGEGQSVAGRVDLGGRPDHKKKTHN